MTRNDTAAQSAAQSTGPAAAHPGTHPGTHSATQSATHSAARHPFPLGAYLRELGALQPEQADQVAALQRQNGLRFGEQAVALGLVSAGQVEAALGRQFELRVLAPGHGPVSSEVVAAYRPDCASLRPLRGLRGVLAPAGLPDQGVALAVVSPERGDGRSVIVANLAVLFAQAGRRTLIVDADLRHPRQEALFGRAPGGGLASALARQSWRGLARPVDGLGPLALLPAGAFTPGPEQLLGRPVFAAMLDDLRQQFDVVLLDTPAAASHVDAMEVAGHAGQALVVARSGHSSAARMARLAADLDVMRVRLAGTILRKRA